MVGEIVVQKGMLITLEGGEGAGKSTLQKALVARLRQWGKKVVVTREPGGSDLGQVIREWILEHKVSNRTELLLFLADRAEHVASVIQPALERKEIVLCDRFADSSIAYQGFGRELGERKVTELVRFATGTIWPDCTLLLDIPPEEGLCRCTTEDRIESEELAFHKRVRKGFLTLAEQDPKRFFVLDATKQQDLLIEDAWNVLKTRV